MSGIWMKGAGLVGWLGDVAGYKTGIAVTRPELRKIIMAHKELKVFWPTDFQRLMRIRPEEVETLVAWLLFKLGNTDSPSSLPSRYVLQKKYVQEGKTEIYSVVLKAFADFMQGILLDYHVNPSPEKKAIDPTPFVEQMKQLHGAAAQELAIKLMLGFSNDQHVSPWSQVRQVDWSDEVQLRELFEDEGLGTAYGTFFDQRFIDYLYRNFQDIDRINWRKFEGLTAEFFTREGFEVKVGPGRNDDGVDIRVWPKGSTAVAPTMLIQCKRQKESISKVIVKALYADVVHERATSGLVVTTSCLSPGATKTCAARGYPIETANRGTLGEWLSKMKTPMTGIFMAE